MMLLNKDNYAHIAQTIDLDALPLDGTLPERVIQFGTGVLLRGFSCFFIDQANRKGLFNGRIVVVKSTENGYLTYFQQQDCLYTLHTRGLENGGKVETDHLISAISRVLSAQSEWQKVLEVAKNPNVNILISNTTETGISEVPDSILSDPPVSFPGKVVAYLYTRFQHFQGDVHRGLVILPTELIDRNGQNLKKIVLSLAKKEGLPEAFIHWVRHHNHFCNTLVDRIVPGKTDTQHIGYTDNLAITAEPFFLWAIESVLPIVRRCLSFAQASENIQFVLSVEYLKEIKLRLLNGTHTLTCGLALLANHPFVKTTLEDPVFFKWIQHLIHNEIIPCLIYQGIPQTSIQAFTITLIDRFKNPYLQHQWNSIAINYTAKLKYRVVPMLKVWYTVHHQAPNSFAFGFAVYIYFMKSQLERTQFSLSDPSADRIYIHLQQEDDIINNILADAILWGEDLTVYPSWSKSVKCIFQQLQTQNIQEIIQKQVRDQP